MGKERWLAAKALVAERAALGHNKPVYLDNVVRPMDIQEFASLAHSAGIKRSGGLDGVLSDLVILRAQERLPLYALQLTPSSTNNKNVKVNDLSSMSDKSGNQVADEKVTEAR